eukprot:CAMPEP_0194552774 /NCGR_PEP_ID=MMETSP0253-20130528/96892_1 /TAXON_ID=2966 /ORGANISM="Noctiluca scintillans" /LENGTH=451 /DNA_ID=CAMNT_0039400247 /DNA_START=105 /DNA_END=1461 /DNA_ORIENTATION=-
MTSGRASVEAKMTGDACDEEDGVLTDDLNKLRISAEEETSRLKVTKDQLAAAYADETSALREELERLVAERDKNARSDECASGKARHRESMSTEKRDIVRHLRSRIESMETVFADRFNEKTILEERYAALLAESNQWEESVNDLKAQLEREISEHRKCDEDLKEDIEQLNTTLESKHSENSKLEVRVQNLGEEQERLLGENQRNLDLLAQCKGALMMQRAAIQNRIEGEKQLQGRVSVLPTSAVEEEEEADELESLMTMASTRAVAVALDLLAQCKGALMMQRAAIQNRIEGEKQLQGRVSVLPTSAVEEEEETDEFETLMMGPALAAPATPPGVPAPAPRSPAQEVAAGTLSSEAVSETDSDGMLSGDHNRMILRLFKKLLQERYHDVPADELTKALRIDSHALAAADESKFLKAPDFSRPGAGDVQELQVLMKRSLKLDPRLVSSSSVF